MIPDYLKLNSDLSLSPDVGKFLENKKIDWEEIEWSGNMNLEGVLFEVGFVGAKKSVIFLSHTRCFSVSIEEFITSQGKSK